ncbi:FtsX-like permease family protein [Corticicoccus populi]|uniref:FtsX-like permease family protein n=1 Tax=Corticicoccus populi TaxID=1812821 RepID=A0ABW5WUM8_9STAP
MSLNSLIVKNFFKNLKNYGLYIFSLIFSVALYFSLLLLSKDQSASEEISSSTGLGAMFTVGSVLTLIIIVMFVCFANMIFIKRRHKELALFQLVGMNKMKIFRILALENALMYFGSLIAGIGVGVLISRLFMMVLLKVMRVDMEVSLLFSGSAVIQTALVFIAIFVVLMVQNYLFLRGKKLIDLLKLGRTSEQKVKAFGAGTVIFGIIGILMIGTGYYLSTIMFDSAIGNPIFLFILMPLILFLTIAGTYITFKCSVAFILNMIRKRKGGHVNVNDVLSTTSIMFKMKSNSFLLTVITTLTALSISLMSMAYISYYSVDSQIENLYPYDYTFMNEEDYDFYTSLLEDNDIEVTPQVKNFIHYEVKEGGAVTFSGAGGNNQMTDGSGASLVTISENEVDDFDVAENEVYITGINSLMETFMEFNTGEIMTFMDGEGFERSVEVVDITDGSVLPTQSTFGMPVAVVDDTVYQEMEENVPVRNTEFEYPTELYALDITDGDNESVLELMDSEENPPFESKQISYTAMFESIGLTMFIVGFVGFSFLLTSGCILYFKQIGECEDEKGSYKVLRKLGFSENEIIRGLSLKMVITFGIPLVIGLGHTYFAVKAGWFIFGTELWTPMLTVMVVYTILYSIFALLSLGYYKKVVRQSL